MSDLVSRLLAAIAERESAARNASGDWERQGPATGEHWEWVRSGHYDPLIDQPVDLDAEDPVDEFIANGSPVSLRSVEEYPTEHVGPLPHFVVNGEGETARAPARHIVLHDPASVLRLCQAHREIVARYEHARKRSQTAPEPDRILWHTRTIALIDVMDVILAGYDLTEEG